MTHEPPRRPASQPPHHAHPHTPPPRAGFDPLDRVLPIEHVGDVPSTTLLARQAVESGKIHSGFGVMIVAHSQSVGKGRFGREWYSPPGGLWTTLAVAIDGDTRSFLEGLSLRVGVACLETVRRTLAHYGHGAQVTLKWPNDILINEKKVCGNICQIIHQAGRAYLLIGVGMNVNNNPDDLPEDLRRPATSLSHEIRQPVDLPRLERELRANLHRAATSRGPDIHITAAARECLHGMGRTLEVRLPTGEFRRGIVRGISNDGRLELECASNPGEIFLTPPGADLA